MMLNNQLWSLTILTACLACVSSAERSSAIDVGFGVVEITPDLNNGRPVFIAGYGQNRKATGVHDPLYARAVVLKDGPKKVALVEADVVGLFYPTTLEVRERLPDFDYVMVAATHNHEGPDTMGLWGPSAMKSGVDPEYMRELIDRLVEAVQVADKVAKPATASYGTAEDTTLLRDSRLPTVYDGVLRVVRFTAGDGSAVGLIIQWNCHPEAMGSKNTELTADFLHTVVANLEKKYGCPVLAISGAVGGLMAPPRGTIHNDDGKLLEEGDFEYCQRYGQFVGNLAEQAIDASKPIELTPIVHSSKQIGLPMINPIYKLGATMGLLKRQIYSWTGDFRKLGEPIPIQKAMRDAAVASEVSYLRLGDLHVAGIPGELYPELVYGKFQEPVEANVDFPQAPLEKSVVEILPGEKFLMVGLANDELGYIIPKRQWDDQAPFAYGRDSKQYGEVNSIGPDTAPILMQSLEECVEAAKNNR